jgi:flagellar M-ring protein FliF
MAFWISLRDQLLALWNRWTLGQRVGFSAAAVACIGAVVGTLIWASQPDYVIIASQLKPSEAAEIVGLLETEKIGYKLNYSSSAVSVARSDMSKARLALKDQLGADGTDKLAPEAGFPFPSPRDEDERHRHSLETQIEKAIKRIRGIRSATVQISRPAQTPFAADQSPVTAAVVVDFQESAVSSATAQTVIALVANSVPGLTSDQVVLTDTLGRQLGKTSGAENELTMQMEYRQRLEADLVQKAQSQLDSIDGVRSDVRVTAEIDFDKGSVFDVTFDPEGRAKTSETIRSEKQGGIPAPPVGPPGTATNIPPDANRQASGNEHKSEEIDSKWETSQKNKETIHTPGKLIRLTVSAIVDVRPPSGTSTDPAAPQASGSQLQQEQLEKIIKAAVGFDLERNDEIQVVLAPLAPVVPETPVLTGFVWENWQPLLQSVSLGLAATLVFLIGMMLMKRMKPIVITETVGPGIPLADARRLAAISEQAKANPDVVATILSAWLNEQETPAAASPAATPPVAGRDNQKSPPQQSSAAGNSVPRSAMPSADTESRKAA